MTWNYIEFPTGPDYTSFEDGRLAGGFWKEADLKGRGPLVVVYAVDLAGMEAQVSTSLLYG